MQSVVVNRWRKIIDFAFLDGRMLENFLLPQGMCMLSFIPLLVHITPYHLSSSWLEKLLIALIDSLSCWQVHLPINAWSRTMSGTKYSLSCFISLHPSRQTLPP